MNIENKNAIFKKTDKGQTALKLRDPSLSQKLRTLLILIDGKKNIGELSPLLPGELNLNERLQELLNAELIEEVVQTNASLPIRNTETESIASSQKLESAIRSATNHLANLLGPNSDVLCIQLEKCKNKDEFNAKILEFRKIVSSIRSEKQGDEFVKSLIF
jgi:hypothetical protein